MELLLDILRALGILRKRPEQGPARPRKQERKRTSAADADPLEKSRRAIAEDDPASVARAIKRMIGKDS